MTPQEHEQLKALLGGMKDAVIVEAGAHDTETTRKLLRMLPNEPSRYLAIEADSRNMANMLRSMPECVTPVHAALWSKVGTVMINMASNTYSSTVREPTGHLRWFPSISFDEQEPVEAVTLDVLAERYGFDHINLLWLDIEGAEKDAIMGGGKILRATDYIWTEVWNEEAYRGQALRGDLLRLLDNFFIEAEFEHDILLKRKDLL